MLLSWHLSLPSRLWLLWSRLYKLILKYVPRVAGYPAMSRREVSMVVVLVGVAVVVVEIVMNLMMWGVL